MISIVRNIAALGLVAALAASPAAAQIITPGNPGNQLTNNTWSPDLDAAPFWDNYSADGTQTATNCNVGFFALGTMDTNCDNAIPGTYSSLAGILANPYGYTTAGPTPFGFAPGGYYLTLLGGLHGSESALFTYACGKEGCGFLDFLTEFDDNGVGLTRYVDYSWLDDSYSWSFGYYNDFNPENGCGAPVPLGSTGYCAGSNDGTSLPAPGTAPQFFALFESNNPCEWGHHCYLVGAEDNALEYLPNVNYRDGDYQDWLIGVTPTPEPATMALLATGLVGLGGASLLRRRNKKNA